MRMCQRAGRMVAPRPIHSTIASMRKPASVTAVRMSQQMPMSMLSCAWGPS